MLTSSHRIYTRVGPGGRDPGWENHGEPGSHEILRVGLSFGRESSALSATENLRARLNFGQEPRALSAAENLRAVLSSH